MTDKAKKITYKFCRVLAIFAMVGPLCGVGYMALNPHVSRGISQVNKPFSVLDNVALTEANQQTAKNLKHKHLSKPMYKAEMQQNKEQNASDINSMSGQMQDEMKQRHLMTKSGKPRMGRIIKFDKNHLGVLKGQHQNIKVQKANQ